MLSLSVEQCFYSVVCIGENCYIWSTEEAILEFQINRQFTEQILSSSGAEAGA